MVKATAFCGFLFFSVSVVCGFVYQRAPFLDCRSTNGRFIQSTKNDNDNDNVNDRRGYRFGDISRSILKKAANEVSKRTTGKDTYEFGDISRWLDRAAKDRIQNITGKENYVFGDLTRWVDEQAKSAVSNFTGKDTYEFGSITAEVIRRIKSGEYAMEDVYLALKVLISAGISVTPIAKALPAVKLLNLVNFGLAKDLNDKALAALAKNLDERVKLAITGDANYKLGDIAAREIEKKIMGLIGKDNYGEYKFGDISRHVASLVQRDGATSESTADNQMAWSEQATKELADWDRRLLDSQAPLQQKERSTATTRDDDSYGRSS